MTGEIRSRATSNSNALSALDMTVDGFTGRKEKVGAPLSDSRGIAIARVLVTVAIVAIVATVALPISRDHLESTHVAQAIADLGAIEIAISRYQAQNRGELPTSLADLPIGVEQWQDPWGSSYQYLNLESTLGEGLGRMAYENSAINRDYDLYSMGKDRRSTQTINSPLARDDVIRGLSGSYFGSVAEYPQEPSRR